MSCSSPLQEKYDETNGYVIPPIPNLFAHEEYRHCSTCSPEKRAEADAAKAAKAANGLLEKPRKKINSHKNLTRSGLYGPDKDGNVYHYFWAHLPSCKIHPSFRRMRQQIAPVRGPYEECIPNMKKSIDKNEDQKSEKLSRRNRQ